MLFISFTSLRNFMICLFHLSAWQSHCQSTTWVTVCFMTQNNLHTAAGSVLVMLLVISIAVVTFSALLLETCVLLPLERDLSTMHN